LIFSIRRFPLFCLIIGAWTTCDVPAKTVASLKTSVVFPPRFFFTRQWSYWAGALLNSFFRPLKTEEVRFFFPSFEVDVSRASPTKYRFFPSEIAHSSIF